MAPEWRPINEYFLTHTNDTLNLGDLFLYMSYVLAHWRVKLKFYKNLPYIAITTEIFGCWQQEQNSFYLLAATHFHGHESIVLLPSHILNLKFIYFYNHTIRHTKLSQRRKVRWAAPTYAQNGIVKNNFSLNFRDITSPTKFNYNCIFENVFCDYLAVIAFRWIITAFLWSHLNNFLHMLYKKISREKS